MTFFDLALRTESSLHPFSEPDDLISTFTGVVRAEGEAGARRAVGKLRAWRINAAVAAAAGEPLFDVCDAHSHELHVVHTLLYEPGGYAPRLRRGTPPAFVLEWGEHAGRRIAHCPVGRDRGEGRP